MAERIDELQPSRIGRPSLYPWDEWMDGSAWRIRRGVDFDTTAHVMSQLVRQRGLRKGVVVTARCPDADTVEFQYAPPGTEAA